jgi:integrase
MPRRPRRLPPYCYEDTDRHGNVRVYLRRPGCPKVRLHGVAWTPDFMAQYQEALKGAETPLLATKSKPQTWRWLCKQYMASAEFRALSGSTPATRRRNLEWTWDKPFDAERPDLLLGDCPVMKVTAAKLRTIRDLKAGEGVERKAAANLLLKIVGYVFAYGREEHKKIVLTNPVRDIKKLRYKSDGHHPWTEAELQQFTEFYPSGTKERRAMALFLYTFARGCDARLFGPQHVKNGRFAFNQKKTNIWVDLPVMEELAKELALAPRSDLAFILTEYGRTFSEKGFGQWFNEKCRKAGLVNCTAHGIRKGAATIAANNGATVHQLMAMFGWLTERMAIEYTKEVDKRKQADAGMKHVRLGNSAGKPSHPTSNKV